MNTNIEKDVYAPNHYTTQQHQVIEVTRYLDFDLGNAWKYLCRYKYKNAPIQDLLKACWYVNDYINSDIIFDYSKNINEKVNYRLALCYEEQYLAQENVKVKNALEAIFHIVSLGVTDIRIGKLSKAFKELKDWCYEQ